jgi:putative transposase
MGIAAYCFMPDHLHLLTNGLREDSDLRRFVKDLKQRTAFSFKRMVRKELWQRYFYDHVLRPGENWQAVASYIWMNPVRKSLCRDSGDWPFSGSQVFDWKALMKAPEALWVPPWIQHRTRVS